MICLWCSYCILHYRPPAQIEPCNSEMLKATLLRAVRGKSDQQLGKIKSRLINLRLIV